MFKMSHVHIATLSTPNPVAGYHKPMPPPETPGHSQASLAQSPTGLQSQIPWEFSVPLLGPQMGKSIWGPRTSLTV